MENGKKLVSWEEKEEEEQEKEAEGRKGIRNDCGEWPIAKSSKAIKRKRIKTKYTNDKC